MRLAPVRCRVLLHSLLPTDDACSSSSLSTTVIKFSIYWTPLANFLLSRPNSVEYGNCKTTTLLPSAKCTRPLFQGRTGCGGRLSGWHDIVTCQRLVFHFTLLMIANGKEITNRHDFYMLESAFFQLGLHCLKFSFILVNFF